MKIKWMYLWLLLLMAGCSNLETVENRDGNGVLLEKYSRRKDTFAKEGKYTAYFTNGNVSEESRYANDTLHGERKLFYESGVSQSIEYLEHGKYAGKYQKFYDNGQLSNEGGYLDGEMGGIWKRWYPTGELMEEVSFSKNEENGPFKEYYQNGRVKAEGAFLDGDNEHGELKKYAENGGLEEKMYCQYGICMTSWTKDQGDVPVDSALMQQLVELKQRKDN